MKKIFICLLLIGGTVTFGQTEKIIDHLCTDLYQIPENWIDSAKAKLNIRYAHASHGSHLTTGGMTAIVNYSPEYAQQYAFNSTGSNGALTIDEYIEDLEHESDIWVNTTETYIENHPQCNVIMWAWCGIYGEDVDQYLVDMEELIAKYSPGGTENRDIPVTFVYMTAHTWPWGEIGQFTYEANQKIRNHCEQNNRWLYDFYDIECYDPDGEYFGDGNPDGSYSGENRLRPDMSYDLPAGGRGNWGIEWMEDNPSHELAEMAADNICTSCEHSDGEGNDDNSRVHCVMKGMAAWYLWARLAGWQEEPPTYVESIDLSFEGSNVMNTGEQKQFYADVTPENATNPHVYWTVNNLSGEATVNSNGMLTAVSEGNVEVQARALDGSGILESVAIQINNPDVAVSNIEIYNEDQLTSVGLSAGNLQFYVSITPEDATNMNVLWSVDNMTGEAEIDEDGNLTLLSAGTVTVVVHATDGSGISDTYELEIVENIILVDYIDVQGENGVNMLPVGSTLQMVADIFPKNATHSTVIWEIQELDGKAIIDHDGRLLSRSQGTVNVIAKTTDGSNIRGDRLVTISGVTGINNPETTGELYFNDPYLYIPGANINRSRISIYSITGQLIGTYDVSANPVIDLAYLDPGLYIGKINGPGYGKILKFIKK